jgi:hypothetical protein
LFPPKKCDTIQKKGGACHMSHRWLSSIKSCDRVSRDRK